MQTTRIVTDSTSDLGAEEAASLGITVVPLTVFFGEEALLDGVEITPVEFYRRLAASKSVPRTSQPSAGRFEEAYERLAAEGAREIVSIHLSSKLSGTLGTARIAAQNGPSSRSITTIDSQSVAGGLGALAKRAASLAAAGASASAVEQAVRAMIPRHHIFILLDTLEYLQRGGRIGRARAWIGSVLNIKPIITVEDGEVAPGERVRSHGRGIERIFDLVTATPELEGVIVQHTGVPAEADALAKRIRSAMPGVDVDVRWIGPVVGVYAGPGGIGAVAVQRVDEPA